MAKDHRNSVDQQLEKATGVALGGLPGQSTDHDYEREACFSSIHGS